MNRTPRPQLRKNTLVRRAMAACVVAILIAAIVLLGLEVRNQLSALRSSAAENVQWSLGQAETEIMSLEIAVLEAQAGPSDAADLREVRLRFDVVYSRIDLLRRASVLDDLRSRPDVAQRLDSAAVFRETWVPLIDGPDADLRAALPGLLNDARKVRRGMRAMALEGVTLFARVGDERRDAISTTLFRIAMMTVALIAILMLLVLAMQRLTRQREREAARSRATRDRMETIISTSLDAVVVVDLDGKILEYNGAAERVFGYTRTEAIGAEMADLLVPDKHRAAHDHGMSRYIAQGHGQIVGQGAVQMESKRRDGTHFPCEISLASAQSPGGEIFVAFLRDISDRVASEETLRRALEQAIAGERQKAELLAVMSHEMRTPLNGMLGTLELFDSDHLDDNEKRYLRIIRHSGDLLLGHVNEVLDISRLDAGKVSLRRTGFDLVTILEQIIEGQAGRARAQGNTLRLAPPNPALHAVHSDPDRLRQVLLNLVSNAIKFTRDGEILIETEVLNGLDEVEIRVIDSGVGIAPEDMERIFNDFVTIDSSYGRRNTGTGLGLGISRRLARALGGTLGAESEPGSGSVFWLRLPLVQTADDSAETALQITPEAVAGIADPVSQRQGDARPVPPLKVLLVEDNAINREVAREMLRRDGHAVLEAVDGESGVTLAAQTPFDLVLMDISMPGMDGLEAAREMRRGHGLAMDVPIIATTAHALPDEVRTFREAGMNTVLTKPITKSALRAAMREALAAGAGAQEAQEQIAQGQVARDEAALTPRAQGSGVPDAFGTTPPAIDWGHFDEVREDLPPERLTKALRIFGQEMQAFLHLLPDTLCAQPDVPEATRRAVSAEAHRLAGSAGVFGAIALTKALRDMQVAALEAPRDDTCRLSAALEPLWQDVVASFESAGYDLAASKSATDAPVRQDT